MGQTAQLVIARNCSTFSKMESHIFKSRVHFPAGAMVVKTRSVEKKLQFVVRHIILFNFTKLPPPLFREYQYPFQGDDGTRLQLGFEPQKAVKPTNMES